MNVVYLRDDVHALEFLDSALCHLCTFSVVPKPVDKSLT